MYMYITLEARSGWFDGVENMQKVVGQIDLKKFVQQGESNLSHIKRLIIDLDTIYDGEDEIMSALELIQSMYKIPILIFNVGATGDLPEEFAEYATLISNPSEDTVRQKIVSWVSDYQDIPPFVAAISHQQTPIPEIPSEHEPQQSVQKFASTRLSFGAQPMYNGAVAAAAAAAPNIQLQMPTLQSLLTSPTGQKIQFVGRYVIYCVSIALLIFFTFVGMLSLITEPVRQVLIQVWWR